MMFTLRKHNRWLTTATATALVKKNTILMIVGFGEQKLLRCWKMLQPQQVSSFPFLWIVGYQPYSSPCQHPYLYISSFSLLIRLWLQLSFLWECSRWGGVSRLDPSDSSDGCTHQDTEPNPRLDLILYHAGANQNKTHRSCKLVFMRLFTTKLNPNRGFSLSNLTSDACLRCLFYHLGIWGDWFDCYLGFISVRRGRFHTVE